MALILKGIVKLYYFLNEEIADTRTQEWPLMKTPWPGFGFLVIYLLLVLKWLPKYMEGRPAFKLRHTIAIYNAFQIICCAYVFYKSLALAWLNHYSIVCQPLEYGPQALEYAWKVCYYYFLIKLMDLLDTVFFILRKKQNQVTFLHIYHHFGMVALTWGAVKWVPGGHCTLIIPINCFVHMIMYTYYLLTIWDDSYKQSIWWKKHVTQMQILQFSILLVHFLALAFAKECPFPREPAYILIPQNLFMVLLFGDFYYRTYIKTKKN